MSLRSRDLSVSARDSDERSKSRDISNEESKSQNSFLENGALIGGGRNFLMGSKDNLSISQENDGVAP